MHNDYVCEVFETKIERSAIVLGEVCKVRFLLALLALLYRLFKRVRRKRMECGLYRFASDNTYRLVGGDIYFFFINGNV